MTRGQRGDRRGQERDDEGTEGDRKVDGSMQAAMVGYLERTGGSASTHARAISGPSSVTVGPRRPSPGVQEITLIQANVFGKG